MAKSKELKNRDSQVVTVRLNTKPLPAGTVDLTVDRRAMNSGLLNRVVELCQPKVMIIYGNPVQEAASVWLTPAGEKVLCGSHPSK